jgi:hypothetical protein
MSQTCANIRESITDYLLGTLDETGRQAMTDHLNECPDCWAYMKALENQERALTTLGEQIDAGMAERREKVIQALEDVTIPMTRAGSICPAMIRIARLAIAAVLVLSTGIAIGRFTAPGAVDVDRLKTDLEASLCASLTPQIEQSVLTDVDRRLSLAIAAGNEQVKSEVTQQVAEDLRVVAIQLASSSKTMVETRLAELVKVIEAARLRDRQQVVQAIEQIEQNRLDDRNRIAMSLYSLAAPQDAATTLNN